MTHSPASLSHRLTRMSGRDPGEGHRAATPLELLYDLTFVVAFGAVSSEMAGYLADGHAEAGIWGFVFAVFAVSLAWINYSWFASAYDTDDWFVRIATLVQMVGVIILTLGLPAAFASIDEGATIANGVMVAGYVVMRVPMIALWIRAALHDPGRRRSALAYAISIGLIQVLWVGLAIVQLPLAPTAVLIFVIGALELAAPLVIERRGGTPWHPHHIAERYGLLTIITLGEVVLGTVMSTSAVISERGWSSEAIVLTFAGTALAFALWWVYFTMPAGSVLARFRRRGFGFGYGHFVIFGAIVAVGAGLHVMAYSLEGEAHLDAVAVMLSVAVPVGVLLTAIFVVYSMLLGTLDGFHVPLFIGSLVPLAASVVVTATGAPFTLGLALIVLAPVVVVVGFETVGHRHQAETLERILA